MTTQFVVSLWVSLIAGLLITGLDWTGLESMNRLRAVILNRKQTLVIVLQHRKQK